MMKKLLTCVLVLVTASACSSGAISTEIPFKAKKGEVSFLQKCIEDSLPCVWYYWRQESAGLEPVVTTTYAFKSDELASGFSTYYTCSESKLISATVYRNGKKQEYALQKMPKNEDLCMLSIPPVVMRAGSRNSTTFLRIVHSISLTSEIQGYQLEAMLIQKGWTSKVAVFSDDPMFLETDLAGSPYRKEIAHGNGIIEEFKAGPRKRYLALSTHPDWKSYADLYRPAWKQRLESFKVPESIFGGGASALDRSVAAFRHLNLAYKVNARPSTLQNRTIDDILSSREGDCKDFVLLMAAILKHEGIRSEPVVVRLEETPGDTPMMKFLPDAYWTNHQVLFLPDTGQFLDPTTNGNMQIDGMHPAFNTVGIDLYTGKRVIVGQ